ncbi:MAG TPA: translation initiation factor Sui1 [Anaerolinea sp.]|nr:translation initiation factor Sui1 [Anaerolinea sp.]
MDNAVFPRRVVRLFIMPEEYPTVYSSEHGRICPDCGRPVADCACRKPAAPRTAGPIRVARESKGRKGKTVTLVSGLPLAEDDLRSLLGDLKRRCGSGGAIKDGTLEIQGDHRDLVVAELVRRGFPAK